MLGNVKKLRKTVTVDLETFENLDTIKEKTGAQKMFILNKLVLKEIERLRLKPVELEVVSRK
jgi:hypothetical protein